MRVGPFVPCYIDAMFPEVGIAPLELLERFGHDVEYPRDQTCCGQPMVNSGFNAEAAATEALFVRNFSGFGYIVVPSGSCAHHVRDDFDAIEQTDKVKKVRSRTFERVEFLAAPIFAPGTTLASTPARPRRRISKACSFTARKACARRRCCRSREPVAIQLTDTREFA
jgi:Fe-S oxidoreductase